jgi:hypothetical protein
VGVCRCVKITWISIQLVSHDNSEYTAAHNGQHSHSAVESRHGYKALEMFT